jgi:hypothetical protein
VSGDLFITRGSTTVKMSDYNFHLILFHVDPPEPVMHWEEIENRDGLIDLGVNYKSRTLKFNGTIIANDHMDFHLLRNDIYNLFDSRSPFYLTSSYEPGKRFYVKTQSIKIEQKAGRFGLLEVELISPSPYAESIGTTTDPKTFDAQVWQTGGGVTLDETHYTHTTQAFSIYNATDGVTIDPRIMPLVISYTGNSTNLAIKNNTNGTEWNWQGATVGGDQIKLDGVRALKNGLSIFGASNRKLITLSPGQNDFTLVGASSPFTISFAFRFYTL